jgi:adenosylhomocysteine nucleosidase
MKILILVAIEDELKRTDLPNLQIEYIGVGKVNAAFNTLKAIQKYSPDIVINFGTAGSLDPNIKGLVEVSKFLQRDMDASPLGFEIGQTPFENDIEITFGRQGVTCGSGDKFVTSTPRLQTDIVDMEAFAIAKVCKLESIDFRCFKFISDNADNEAKNDWVENVSLGSKVFIETINKLENQ